MMGHEDVRKAEEVGIPKGDPFIITYTGNIIRFNHLTPECIDIRDIAHSLSHLCRYTGHTNMFYSVAQHSLLVSEKIQGGPAVKLTALLHDAAEAYTNDLSSPLKKWMNQEGECCNVYASLQDTLTALIYNKYGVTNIHRDVRYYDLAACVFEAEGFMGLGTEELMKYNFPMEFRGLWQPWDPKGYAGTQVDREFGEVETEFLKRFEDLMASLGRKDNDS